MAFLIGDGTEESGLPKGMENNPQTGEVFPRIWKTRIIERFFLIGWTG